MSFIVGLTGGIGCGKTVISDYLGGLGVPVIDTDVIAREVVRPGQPALEELVKEFGAQILLHNGELNRDKLRGIAFSSQRNKQKLDGITHPAIRRECEQQIKQIDSAYGLVVVPLLTASSPFLKLMQRVLVVTAERKLRIQRVQTRSSLTREQVEAIMATQISDEQRLEFADDVIANNGTIQEAQRAAQRLHETYLNLAQGQ
ncbi:dephospho-CoA kinase [Arenicella chitinivorans]|uniref:Dephospho-CoA kinase n=1 Tax=Arenicella chitinivorans TaxID=1329800 RepID=A0A918VKG9_9GAMM|nr:dephospho-CoA kinase [Arenicella chitinivorans]GHA05970.1 dephospho-CoA kinase [Arenicella chitinivorans]